MVYHKPALLEQSIDGLNIDPDGVYVDVTFGGGGHSAAILDRLSPRGRLLAFDQDADASSNLLNDERFIFIPQNFIYLKNYLRLHRLQQVDGLLADLGVSFHQFDEAGRGFSFREDGPLDMRMDRKSTPTAAQILNEYEEAQLASIFYKYGELRNAAKIASTIVMWRAARPFRNTSELVESVSPLVPEFNRHKVLAQIFQAIRIEVNNELEAVEKLLQQANEVIKPAGRLVVISYHSLEDRLVKNFIRTGRSGIKQPCPQC